MTRSTNRRSSDAIIIGGGAVGCAVAFALAQEGLAVHLLERDQLASQASGAMAGMLAPIAEAHEPGPFLHFGLESLRIYPELCRELRECSGVDPEYWRSGILRLARDETEAIALKAMAERSRPGEEASPSSSAADAILENQDRDQAAAEPATVNLEWLEPAEVFDLAPAVSREVCGGLWSPDESQIRSPLLTLAYARSAERLGARIECGESVLGLLSDSGRITGVRTSWGELGAGVVILCAGSWSGVWLGEALSESGVASAPVPVIRPERGQLAILDSPRPAIDTILWAGSTYLVPKRDGSVVVGATSEDVGFDAAVTAGGVGQLLDSAQRLAPGLRDAGFQRAWAGLRPRSGDGLPTIGPVPGLDSLYIAAGHHRNGVLLSAVTSRLIRDSILEKALPDEAGAFDPGRWS